jgi:hypothetical protein
MRICENCTSANIAGVRLRKKGFISNPEKMLDWKFYLDSGGPRRQAWIFVIQSASLKKNLRAAGAQMGK